MIEVYEVEVLQTFNLKCGGVLIKSCLVQPLELRSSLRCLFAWEYGKQYLLGNSILQF